MVVGVAVKLVICGAGTTEIVTFWLTDVPAELVTDRVYVVVVEGETLAIPPLETLPIP